MDTWNPQANDIFLKALEIHLPQERCAFLDSACSAAPELRAQVEALLEASQQAGSFLESPAAALGFLDTIAGAVQETAREGPGTVIGPYKLLEQIGEGGFGLVFMAEQQQPVRRKVAVKVLKPGMDTRQVIARFEAERQALALMDHPNIAKVLDAGETPGGRPFFVMDLVQGVPITAFCDRAQLATGERLELFVSVCQAVQHAHHKGIIHRDLKPSNVLVTVHDGSPLAKVIDFGIAKAASRQLTDQTLFTGFMQMMGTPLYMSPEQATLSHIDVDTRSDVYSLGVLLYELLTGATPFDQDRLRQADYDELRRILGQEEPPRPSARLSTLGPAAVTIASKRQTDPRRLSQLLGGELDWIVMKALEKDRNRRYQTAGALAADLEHYLRDEPVAACPPSALYRFGKLARRHKAALAAAGAVSATLIAAVVGLLLANYQITEQRNLAQREHEQSEASLQQARKAVDDYFTAVSESQLLDVPGLDSLRQQLLETALNYYQDFIRQHGDESQLQADVAAAHLRVAEIIYLNGGGTDQYFPHLRDGVDIVERLIQEHRDTPEVQKRLAGLYLTGKELDISAHGSVELPEVVRYLTKLAVVLEKFASDNPDSPELRNDLAGACRYIAQAYSLSGLALPWFEKAITLWEGLVRDHPTVAGYRENLARVYELRAMHLNLKGHRTEADQSTQKALLLRRDLVRDYPYPARPRYAAWLAVSYRTLGESQTAAHHLQEAEETLGQALALQQRLAADFPTLATYRRDLAQTQLALARVMKERQHPAEAAAAYRQALAGRQQLLLQLPNNLALYRDDYLAAAAEAASFLAGAGRFGEAAAIRQQALKTVRDAALLCQQQMQTPTLSLPQRLEYGQAAGALATRATDLGQDNEADKLFHQTAALFEKLLAEVGTNFVQRAAVQRSYILLLQAQGDAHAAWAHWDRSLAAHTRWTEVEPGDHWSWFRIAALYLDRGEVESYRRSCREMLDRFGDTSDTVIAERAAKTCALAPDAVADLAPVLQLANQAVEGQPANRWCLLAKALVEYRAAHHPDVIEWLKQLSPKVRGEPLDSSAFALLAMARYRLGRLPEAASALASARAILADKMPDPRHGRPFAPDWHDWLRARILCREAERLCRSAPAPAPAAKPE